MNLLAALVAAYLVGGIPTSYLAAKLGAQVDLRDVGSKNVGATNLYRVLGWKYALPAGVVDVAKGLVPVVVANRVTGQATWIPLLVGAAAILGHVFPVFLRFRGGKGVATAAGVVIGVAPIPFLVSLGVWAVLLAATGFVSVASMIAALVFPLAAWLLTPGDGPLVAASLIIASFILFTHRSNLRRLRHGTELRFRGWRRGS